MWHRRSRQSIVKDRHKVADVTEVAILVSLFSTTLIAIMPIV
jgi:hypothetical protein